MTDRHQMNQEEKATTSRRSFLGGTAAASAAAAIDQSKAANAVGHKSEALTADHFAGFLGQNFRVLEGVFDGHVMKLSEVESHDDTTFPANHRRPFSLVFRASADVQLPQGNRRFHHPGFGSFDAFVVPVGPNGDDVAYEVIFS